MNTAATAAPSTEIPEIDDVHAHPSGINHDPFKYSHGLTGVDQPANYFFVNILIATLLIPTSIAIVLRLLTGLRNDRRRASVVTSCRSPDFWKKDRYVWWGHLKRYFLYAPLWTKRRSQEIKMSNTQNVGTLPNRPQFLVILVYVLSNIAYCVTIQSHSVPEMLAELRGRCGALAAFNLIFTILFALRNNPFLWLLHISYDTFNMFHRWTARLVVLQSIVHIFAFAYNTWQAEINGRGGWQSIIWVLQHSLSYRWGLVSFSTFIVLVVQSLSPLRHAFYETFLTLHRLGVILAVTGVYFHLAKHALPQMPWVYFFVTLLALEFLVRSGRILYANFCCRRFSWTKVRIEALAGEATRVTFLLPRSWDPDPGSHIHIYLPRLGLWSSHPFSVAWTQSSAHGTIDIEKLPFNIDDLQEHRGPSTVSCIIRARTGMTRALYDLASRFDGEHVTLWGAVEGPYGNHHSLNSYGTVVLFAAGVGITHHLCFVRHLLIGHNHHMNAMQKLLLIWCIKDLEALEWIQPWLEEISGMENFASIVRIRIHASKMTTTGVADRRLPQYLDLRMQRCDPQAVIDEEVLAQVGAMVVTVCGPSSFGDCVREAVRRRMCIRSIDFVEEAFSY